MATHHARLVRTAIDVGALTPTAPADGALCLFLGVVRDQNDGRRVLRLDYEAYEDMALPLMEEIAAEARARFGVSEVRSVHWLSLERLVHPGSRAVHDYAHEGVALKFPCLRLEDIVIWGLTYRMFETLAERLAACIAGTVQLAGVREDERP